VSLGVFGVVAVPLFVGVVVFSRRKPAAPPAPAESEYSEPIWDDTGEAQRPDATAFRERPAPERGWRPRDLPS
jgi:hypothetical protein